MATDIRTFAETFNGWANYETWNVALWLMNDFAYYRLALRYDRYNALIPALENEFGQMTPDGVRWMDAKICTREITNLMLDMQEDAQLEDAPMPNQLAPCDA